MNYQLDLTEFTCPLPLLTAKKVLAQSAFRLLCEAEGYLLISIEKPTALYTKLTIQK